jgi:hypothetical protein
MAAKSKKERDVQFFLIALLVVLFIISSWLINYYLLNRLKNDDKAATGEMFGAVNALYSGLALAGIILTILLQRRELKETRKEFKVENETSKTQQFESTFFNLLENQLQITKDLQSTVNGILQDFTQAVSKKYEGREFFMVSKSEIARILKALAYAKYDRWDYWTYAAIGPTQDDPTEENTDLTEARIYYANLFYNISEKDWKKAKKLNLEKRVTLAYGHFLIKHHHAIGHYFRHLYYILKFLQNSEKDQLVGLNDDEAIIKKKKFYYYAQFVQAQMSEYELMLLYYHCLFYPNMKKLLVHYKILNNVAIEDLVATDHNFMADVQLKSRKSILESL